MIPSQPRPHYPRNGGPVSHCEEFTPHLPGARLQPHFNAVSKIV